MRGIKYGAAAAGHTALNFLTPGAQEVAQQLMLPDAWAKIKATSKFTWRGVVNCSFLTWTVLKPGVLVLIPLWDFVWDGIEPVLVRIKDSVVDGVDDAMFTFEEAFSEAMGPTVAGVEEGRLDPWRGYPVTSTAGISPLFGAPRCSSVPTPSCSVT